jgi:peptidyl-prolyl cis-trans isomerase C
MQRPALFAALALVSGLALAQNVAVVNNKPIPKVREDAWVKELVKQGQKDTPELRKMVKERLIQNEVLLQEANKRGIPEQPEVKFMLDLQRQNTIIQALLRDEMAKNPVTDAQIAAEYEKQKAAVGSKEFRARHILVENQAEAQAGDLDWAAPDAYVQPFAEALGKLKKGETTAVPVQTQFGWHVIRLDDVRDAQFPPLEQVAPQIREALQQQKVQAYVQSLQQSAKIQ